MWEGRYDDEEVLALLSLLSLFLLSPLPLLFFLVSSPSSFAPPSFSSSSTLDADDVDVDDVDVDVSSIMTTDIRSSG